MFQSQVNKDHNKTLLNINIAGGKPLILIKVNG